MSDLKEIVRTFHRDRVAMHRILFATRHTDEDALFHREMVELFHSKEPNVEFIAFRGSAKSTKFEEGVVAKAILREFINCLIFGSSLDRAQERLHAIRRIFEKNGLIREIFGDLKGQPWTDDKLELTTGITIGAMGRGQALRGTKGEELRPDLVIFDDIEDRESVRTPEAREKTFQWFFGDVLPMMDKNGMVRMAANDLDPECLANQLKKDGSGFVVKVYPWEYIDEKGDRAATWPARFPLPAIDAKKEQMTALGRLADYNREYMCASTTPEDKPFKREMFRTEAVTRTWHAVYGFFDPARTIKATSADTGFAAWSYIGNRLVVWDAWGKKLLPDQIVEALFAFDAEFSPAVIGIEEDGLNEFLMQPIRQECLKRGIMLPVRAMKAPKGKLDFIRGLQPFFNAREIVFASELPDLRQQLLSFPTGRIDVPNALAYALKMRPGAPVYEDFSGRHITEELFIQGSAALTLCLNATPNCLTGVLCQYANGILRVLADWVREGEPAELLEGLIKDANLEARHRFSLLAGPEHFERFAAAGLKGTAARAGYQLARGGKLDDGRAEIRDLLKKEVRGFPAVQIASRARWVANGFAGGYAREIGKGSILADHAVEGPYRTLMEGIETFAGLARRGALETLDEGIRYDETSDGRRYMTARR